MNELISKKTVLDALAEISREVDDGYGFDYAKWREYFCELPPAELATDTNVGIKLGTNLAEVGKDLISRQAAIEAVQNRHMMLSKEKVLLINDLEKLPPTEPKTGKWVFKNDLLTVPTGYWECSECKEGRLLYEANFCPNCGAKMEVTE